MRKEKFETTWIGGNVRRLTQEEIEEIEEEIEKEILLQEWEEWRATQPHLQIEYLKRKGKLKELS